MRNSLLVFRSFAHDSQRVLANIYGLARVSIELLSNHSRCVLYREFFALGDLELLIAIRANSEMGSRADTLYDTKFSFQHDLSLRPSAANGSHVDFKRHHYQKSFSGEMKIK